MCKNLLQDFFKRILLGQKGVRQFLGSFFLIWEFSLEFPSFPAIQGHQRSFRSDPNVDGLLQRAGVNYKWPVELGKCSKGSRGHPEANFFRRISCWPFLRCVCFFAVGMFHCSTLKTQERLKCKTEFSGYTLFGTGGDANKKNQREGLWTLLHPLFLWHLPQGREL